MCAYGMQGGGVHVFCVGVFTIKTPICTPYLGASRLFYGGNTVAG